MKIAFDKWQQEIVDYRGDIILCKGRRIGGTEIFAIKAAERMVSDPGIKIVFLSLTEDQAKLIIMVALEHLTRKYPKMIAKGKNKPTQSQIILTNKASTKVRPVGNTGNAVRGFDGDILGIDEAPWQPKMMWKAARPIISTNNGEIWMWGTPADKEGYFWEQYDKAYNKKDPNARFKVWHKNSEDVLFNRPVCESWTQSQHDGAIRILGEEKRDMSELEYGNEYLGLFLEDLQRLFTQDWIRKVMTLKRDGIIRGKAYIGVDVAGMGKDLNAIEGIDKVDDDHMRHFENITTSKEYTFQTKNRIVALDQTCRSRKIGVDDGGVGFGVFSELLEDQRTRDKTIPLNNASRPLDGSGKRTKRILKEEMYMKTLTLGERGILKLLRDVDAIKSFESVLFEMKDGRMHIFGKDTHIVEGVNRAVFLAAQDKSLKLWAR